jgi:hypothetical protein
VSHKWAFSYRLRLELARRAKTPHRAEDLLHPAVVLVFGCTLHDEALRALAMPRARCARPSYRSGTHGRLHLLATLVSPAADPVLEPPIRLVEGSVGRRVSALEAGAFGRDAADEKLAPRKPDIDGDAIPIAVAMVVTRQLDHDVTRDHAIEEVLEPAGATLDMRSERVRVGHASERELKGHLHGG